MMISGIFKAYQELLIVSENVLTWIKAYIEFLVNVQENSE